MYTDSSTKDILKQCDWRKQECNSCFTDTLQNQIKQSAAGLITAIETTPQSLHQCFLIFCPLFFLPSFTYLFVYLFIFWNKSIFQFSQNERGHYETNGWPSILFVTNGSNYDPIIHPGVCLPRKINQSISKVWNTHEAETNADNQTKVNYRLRRMSTLARLHTSAIYASPLMKASKYATKTSMKF
jgi:hypothetical protein